MVADIRADVEIGYSQDTGPGMVFDVTAINTLSEARVRDYRFKPDSKPDTDGPAAALRRAETTKVRMYGGAYSDFKPDAVDLLGAPARSSRKAIKALCKKAYSGSDTSVDELHINRMRNSIIREVAFAVAKATSDALLRLPRLQADPVVGPNIGG